MTKTCKCCGQTLPSEEPFGVRLTPQQERIAIAVRRAGRHGILSDDLIDVLYSNDPNGGVDTARTVLHVQINRLNKTLKPVGKKISCLSRGAHPGEYVFKDIFCE